jgi:hypothetical protein
VHRRQSARDATPGPSSSGGPRGECRGQRNPSPKIGEAGAADEPLVCLSVTAPAYARRGSLGIGPEFGRGGVIGRDGGVLIRAGGWSGWLYRIESLVPRSLVARLPLGSG